MLYLYFRCAGVELDNITFIDKPLVEQQPDILITKAFYPHYAMDKVDVSIEDKIVQNISDKDTINIAEHDE